MPALTSLNISACPNVADEGLKYLAKAMRQTAELRRREWFWLRAARGAGSLRSACWARLLRRAALSAMRIHAGMEGTAVWEALVTMGRLNVGRLDAALRQVQRGERMDLTEADLQMTEATLLELQRFRKQVRAEAKAQNPSIHDLIHQEGLERSVERQDVVNPMRAVDVGTGLTPTLVRAFRWLQEAAVPGSDWALSGAAKRATIRQAASTVLAALLDADPFQGDCFGDVVEHTAAWFSGPRAYRWRIGMGPTDPIDDRFDSFGEQGVSEIEDGAHGIGYLAVPTWTPEELELNNTTHPLRHLSVHTCDRVTDIGVAAVARAAPQLEQLNLNGTGITDDALDILAQCCTRLTSLDVRNCW